MKEAPSTAHSLSDARRTLSRIALEIFIGFVGVYAAFALSAYKDRRDVIERRHQVKRALIAEIRPIVALARSNRPQYQRFLDAFDSSATAGRPSPHPFLEAAGLSDHVWEATKQAGGLQLIDVPTFYQLSEFYNMNSQMFAQYAQLREFSIAEILPHAREANAFFEPGTTTLRPSFIIYRQALKRLVNMNGSLVSGGDSLIARLARDTI
jgi:hypothetical protein